MSSVPVISVVIPVYRAEATIGPLLGQLSETLQQMALSYELILVCDRSPDRSWEVILQACAADERVKGIQLSRNFGQHYAITAGLDHARGEWVVVMDCDGQDRPAEIPALYRKAMEGYDIVVARRVDRKDGLTKKLFSRLFWNSLGYLTGTNLDHTVANFGIYHRGVVDAVCALREPIRFFPSMVNWVGFSRTGMDVEHAERIEGRSSYNFSRMFALATDVILANSDKPIRLIIRLGFLISLFAFGIGLYYLYLNLTHQIVVPGYTSIILSIWFLSGLIILILGVIGLYIGKTFEGVKDRPIYIIDKKQNI